jgi:DNA-binding GntR family transcriptional regulator
MLNNRHSPSTDAGSAGAARTTIVNAVFEAIADGRLPPGTKLGEDEISGLFSVSRTITREALKELSFQGAVVLQPRRGAFVMQPSAQDAEDLYAARRIIEAAVIEDVAKHCTANDVRTLRGHVSRQRTASRTGDRRTFVFLLGDFHLQIARLGGNQVLLQILEGLIARTTLMTALHESTGRTCVIDDHDRMIDLLASGKARECVTLMKNHLTTNEAMLRTVPTGSKRINLATALRPPRTAPAERTRRQ